MTLTLLLLFFPGIVASQLYDALTVHHKRQPYETFLHSFIFGVSAYLIYALATSFWASRRLAVTLAGLLSPNETLDFTAIMASTGIGVVLAALAAKAYNDRWVHRAAFRMALTRKFGDLDVWSLMHNSSGLEWVTVRDWSKGLTYQGWVQAFSDTYRDNEMLLRDVVVSSTGDGKELYRVKALYITQDPQSLTIEIQYPGDAPTGGEGND